MDASTVALILLFIVPAILIVFCVRIVPDDQRWVVFRLGRFHRLLQPGLRWVIPGGDDVRRVDLNVAVPGWQSLPESELQSRLQHLAVTGQLPIPTA
jgi:regulator of protease activity HflC (stomatin/prohibitin superfamily)